MSAVQHLRQLISERLTAATEEIFGIFEKAIVEYEGEIDRQRRLLDIVWKPHVRLHRAEFQQRYVYKEEEEDVLTEWLCEQNNFSSDQEDPQPSQLEVEDADSPQIKEEDADSPQIKEEDADPPLIKEDADPPQIKEEPRAGQEEDQMGLKQMSDTFTLLCEGSHNSGDQIMNSSPAESQSRAEKEPAFSSSFHEDVTRDHQGSTDGDTGPHKNAGTKSRQRPDAAGRSGNNIHKSTVISTQENTYKRDKSLKCETCGKAFRLMSVLRRHLRTHTGEKPYPCNTCGKRLSDISVLKRHMRVHTGEKPFACSTCEMRFSDLSTLKRHTRIHTGERPYSCETCGRDFRHTCELKVHMRTHTGERPYPCNTCRKCFGDLSTLKRHMRIHTGEKPYSCVICGRDFSQSNGLKIHMTTHRSEKSKKS